MSRMAHWLWGIVWLLLALPAQAAERVALVIGNGGYLSEARLPNARDDARAVGRKLASLGFAVSEAYDLKLGDMLTTLQRFGAAAAGAEVAVVYFSGHGVEQDNRNWLLPVDARLQSSADVEAEAVSLNALVAQAQKAKRLRLVLVDACRNNPLRNRMVQTQGATRSVDRGLKREEPASATYIAFAAKEGTVAQDGKPGQPGPFAAALLEHLGADLPLVQMFGYVSDQVKQATRTQEPWLYFSPSKQLEYLLPRGGQVAAVPPPPPRPAPGPATPAVGTYTAPPGRVPGSTFRDCPECPEMVTIPAGSFTMGVPAGEEEREGVPDDFKGRSVPQHRVTIREFALGKLEVTRGQFAAFANATGHSTGDKCFTYESGKWEDRSGRNWRSPGFAQTDRDPVVCVNWDDAKAYVAWLARQTGKTYRLASEAEWEYAARAGTSSARHWGDAIGSGNANCDGCGSQWDNKQTAPTGSFRANAFGLHDMLGNAWEWTEDCWNGTYAGAPTDGSAWTGGECGRRVLRGGSWVSLPRLVRAGFRNGGGTALRLSNDGFRVARTD